MPRFEAQFCGIWRFVALWVCGGIMVIARPASGNTGRPVIGYDPGVPQAAFAATEIQRALVAKGYAAVERGIETYWFTWNTFVWGAQDTKYGITTDLDNPTTIDYFRTSVRETVLTYPLLAGMGITAGENMRQPSKEFSKEKWLWRTYGEGIRDALKLQPDRQFRLIHRFHMTGLNEVLDEWKQYPGPFDFSFKYAIAHMSSTPTPPFIKDALPHLSPKFRTWLTVRNDDIYSFRWGDIDVRWFPEACKQNPDERGFYTVRHFIEGQTMPGSGILNILQGNNKELRLTLGDLEAMAHLGSYYSEKIFGAVELALFDATGKTEQKVSAITHLEAALDHWRQYSAAYTRRNRQPVLYNRVGWVDIPGLTAKVREDIEMAQGWQPGTIKEQKDRGADTPFRK